LGQNNLTHSSTTAPPPPPQTTVVTALDLCEWKGAPGECAKMADCPKLTHANGQRNLCGQDEAQDATIRCCYELPQRDSACVSYACTQRNWRLRDNANEIGCSKSDVFGGCNDDKCCEAFVSHQEEEEPEEEELLPVYAIVLISICA
jgi:hypothetical protein